MFSTTASAQFNVMLNTIRASYAVPMEQTYMEYDHKSGCYPGDTIRFTVSAYRLDSLTYSDISNVVYVELLSPNGDVIERKCLRLMEGKAHDYIVVDEFLSSGLYSIRAYTRFQSNGREGRCFSRVIPVYVPEDRLSKSEKSCLDKFAYIDNEHFYGSSYRLKELEDVSPRVNLYYEGGHLLNDFSNRVAFHVHGNTVKEAKADIVVRDNLKGAKKSVVTDCFGNASLEIIPRKESSKADFSALFEIGVVGDSFKKQSSRSFRVVDPGMALRVTQEERHVNIDIAYPQSFCDEKVCRVLLSRGRIVYVDSCQLSNDGHESLRLPKEHLQRGINSFFIVRYRKSRFTVLASRSFFVGNINNSFESWMLLESQISDVYIGDYVEGRLTDRVIDDIMLTYKASLPGVTGGAPMLYFRQLNEGKGQAVMGHIRPKENGDSTCSIEGVKVKLVFTQGKTKKSYEVTTNSEGLFFLKSLDLKGDWTLNAGFVERNYRYNLVLDQSFGFLPRSYLLRELDPALYGSKEWRKSSAEKNRVAYIRNMNDYRFRGGVFFMYWLKHEDSQFQGISDEGITEVQTSYARNSSMTFLGGPSYHGRPIVWLVDGVYKMTTGLKSEVSDMVVLKSTEASLPIYTDEVKTVAVSDDLRSYAKSVSSPTLDALKPIVVSIRLNNNYEWDTSTPVCVPFHGLDN